MLRSLNSVLCTINDMLSRFSCLVTLSASTFRFLFEQWKNQLPDGYVLNNASVDKPFEEDACYSHFNFERDASLSNDSELAFEYQWFIGERTSSNFVAISDADKEVRMSQLIKFSSANVTFILFYQALYDRILFCFGAQVYWPKQEDIGKVLKVECTPILDNIKYPTIFAMSRPVSPGIVIFKLYIEFYYYSYNY